jgi:hypothetical protein
MAESTIIREKVILLVEEQTRKGKEGQYTERVVECEGKKYTIGKNSRDKVEVGKTYEFNLSKSEYNDKLYYWANLANSKKEQPPKPSVDTDSTEFKNQVFSYLRGLDRQKQIATVKYILDNLN